MVPDLEDLTYEERLKEMQLTTLKEKENKPLITIHKLINKQKETYIKDLMMTRKGEVRPLRQHKKK